LNGMGLRTKVIFKVYVAGLYVEKPSQHPQEILRADQVRRGPLHMGRDVGKHKIPEAINHGFERNSRAPVSALKDPPATLHAALPDLKDGDELSLTYLPGKGTVVQVPSGTTTLIEGKDFADALFAVWLGADPVDSSVKKGLLGIE